jgi:hypothetical protein
VRRVILDLPEGTTGMDAWRDRTPGSGGGHAAWLRGPRRPSPKTPAEPPK